MCCCKSTLAVTSCCYYSECPIISYCGGDNSSQLDDDITAALQKLGIRLVYRLPKYILNCPLLANKYIYPPSAKGMYYGRFVYNVLTYGKTRLGLIENRHGDFLIWGGCNVGLDNKGLENTWALRSLLIGGWLFNVKPVHRFFLWESWWVYNLFLDSPCSSCY